MRNCFSALLLASLLVNAMPITLLAQGSDAGMPIVIGVIRGEGVVYSSHQRGPETLSVRIVNIKGQPLSGALVQFTSPYGGSGGSFLDGLKTMQVVADANGVASAPGFHPNTLPGPFQIVVTAMCGGQAAYANIDESIAAEHSGFSKRTWWIIAGVAVLGAAGGTYAALRNSGGSSTSISVGTVTVGSPH